MTRGSTGMTEESTGNDSEANTFHKITGNSVSPCRQKRMKVGQGVMLRQREWGRSSRRVSAAGDGVGRRSRRASGAQRCVHGACEWGR